jgi:hypothetical protein
MAQINAPLAWIGGFSQTNRTKTAEHTLHQIGLIWVRIQRFSPAWTLIRRRGDVPASAQLVSYGFGG